MYPRKFVVPQISKVSSFLLSLFLLLTSIQPSFAQSQSNGSQVTFTDVAANDGAGITYRRTPSSFKSEYDAVKVASLDPETPFLPMEMLADLPSHPNGVPGVALLDFDSDGVPELFTADDQAGIPSAAQGGVDRSYVHVYENDGSGSFTDITLEVGTDHASQWMGLAFADFNCDGNMDFFGTNMGDYAFPALGMGPPYELGNSSSRWMLGNGDGSFTDPGLGDLIANPFGWGVSATDYDNDGDTDVIYYGQLDISFNVSAANPGAILQNQGCSADFVRDAVALAESTDHNRRAVQGVATGDLNNDGFIDIVTAASSHYPEEDAPLIPFAELAEPYGSAFDDEAVLLAMFEPVAPGELRWTGYEQSPGNVSVEMSSADNDNSWAQIETMGTIGLTAYGEVNRDGIGAVLTFTPDGGQPVMIPRVGGSGFASQQSHVINFGLGNAEQGTVEILWPGGNRNKVYNVGHGERILLPELPCSYDASWKSGRTHYQCVSAALVSLVEADALSKGEAERLLSSALRARHEHLGNGNEAQKELQFLQEFLIALFSGNLNEFLASL